MAETFDGNLIARNGIAINLANPAWVGRISHYLLACPGSNTSPDLQRSVDFMVRKMSAGRWFLVSSPEHGRDVAIVKIQNLFWTVKLDRWGLNRITNSNLDPALRPGYSTKYASGHSGSGGSGSSVPNGGRNTSTISSTSTN